VKIATIVGARPQFIKCAVLSRELRKNHQEIIIHTGQHYDYGMSDLFFEELSIPHPDYNLAIGSGTHAQQTGNMLAGIEAVLVKEKPDLVIVYGDTNSTLAGALAASKLNIKLAHVEAGLRSFDRSMPEEINRVVTDHLSNLLFAPTEVGAKNLAKEGVVEGVHIVGDVMVDSLLFNKEKANERSKILEKLGLQKHEYLVATVHRQSNTDNIENLKNIIEALGAAEQKVVFPIHPRTMGNLKNNNLADKLPKNIIPVEPLGYLDMVQLMSYARKIITDSGGIQKEAYILHVPCITVRDTTEWVETVEDGWNILVGTDKERIVNAIKEFEPAGPQSDRYGDGHASEKIGAIIDKP
jgi:UDP-N-acetylglucosamine 2-epimerase (non-hydrolysing)